MSVVLSPRDRIYEDAVINLQNGLRVFLGGPMQHLLGSRNSAEVVAAHRDIVEALVEAGCTVFSAHEVEDYGQISDRFLPMHVTIRDYVWAETCDVYVGVLPIDSMGVPYRTDGTHVEIGWVTAMNKQVILLLDDEAVQPYSHLVRGLVDAGRAQVIPLRQWRAHLIPLLDSLDKDPVTNG